MVVNVRSIKSKGQIEHQKVFIPKIHKHYFLFLNLAKIKNMNIKDVIHYQTLHGSKKLSYAKALFFLFVRLNYKIY